MDIIITDIQAGDIRTVIGNCCPSQFSMLFHNTARFSRSICNVHQVTAKSNSWKNVYDATFHVDTMMLSISQNSLDKLNILMDLAGFDDINDGGVDDKNPSGLIFNITVK